MRWSTYLQGGREVTSKKTWTNSKKRVEISEWRLPPIEDPNVRLSVDGATCQRRAAQETSWVLWIARIERGVRLREESPRRVMQVPQRKRTLSYASNWPEYPLIVPTMIPIKSNRCRSRKRHNNLLFIVKEWACNLRLQQIPMEIIHWSFPNLTKRKS